jgi:hypothetical protein
MELQFLGLGPTFGFADTRQTLRTAQAGEVLRGISFAPAQ